MNIVFIEQYNAMYTWTIEFTYKIEMKFIILLLIFI